MEQVASNGVVAVDAAEWAKVSGGMSGWCGNDPLFQRKPPPPDPLFTKAIVSFGDAVSLNPQPLPPKALTLGY